MTYNSSKTGAQVDGAVDDVQAAKAASAVDTTAGRLLKVGDFGVGANNNAAFTSGINSDNISATGVYVGTVTLPTNIGSGWLDVQSGSASNVVNQFHTAWDAGILRHRWKVSNVWSPWRELYHTGNTIVDVNGFIKEA